MKKKKKEEKIKAEKEFLEKLHRPNFRIAKTFGQRAADWITKWAGSWTFILSFFVFLAIWIILNIYFLMEYKIGKPWDPYPFILLNLVLSCLAAIQAPVILMSQNRTSQRDRLKAEFDYRINKKAEKEIREIRNLLLNRRRKRK